MAEIRDKDDDYRSDDPSQFSDDGVDLTLIRWMLSLTPEERIRQLENHAAFVEELRDANANRISDHS